MSIPPLRQSAVMIPGKKSFIKDDVRSKPSGPIERKMEDVVIDIYKIFGIHKSSIVERHISWLAGHTMRNDRVKLDKCYMEISEIASSGSLDACTRLLALKAICTLTVEEPRVRKTFKECTDAIHRLEDLKMGSSKAVIREWASKALDAIKNEKVHKLWSNVITEPVRSDFMKELSKEDVSPNHGVLGDLAKSLKNSDSSYVAELYLQLATNQAIEGPSRNDVAHVCRHIRESLLPSSLSLSNERALALQQLCRKLLKFANRTNTAVAAMEEVIVLATENGHIRKTLRECENKRHYLRNMAESHKKSETGRLASRSLRAIQDENIHALWSAERSSGWSDLRKILDGTISRDGNNRLARLAKSLSDQNSSYIATLYLERATKEIADKIRRVLKHDKTNIFHLHTRTSRDACAAPDVASIRELCWTLLEISKYAVVTIVAAKEIIALSIEDPYVRKTFHGSGRIRHLKDMTMALKKHESPDIFEWASRAIHAVEDENLHGLWSKAITRRLSTGEVQHLIERSVSSAGCKLAELAKSLKSDPGNVHSDYLALQYLKQLKDTKAAQTQDRDSECPSCKWGPKRSQQTSAELLRYVLQSATGDSLKNLCGMIKDIDGRPVNVLGKGGFSLVYEGPVKIKGVRIAVKQLHIDSTSADFVIKNFARELRIFARLNHPNVATLLGYAMEEDKSYNIITEWRERGSLRVCLDSKDPMNTSISSTSSELIDMALGIAKGVLYLHGEAIVHADIKADNILVSQSGRPLLTDFGISRMSESLYSNGFYTTEATRCSIRWTSYEFYHIPNDKKFRPNTKTDVWAYGMTLLELLTRKIPYSDVKGNGTVQRKISEYYLPKMPKFEGECEKAQNEIWRVCMQCWTQDAGRRPEMQAVLWDLIRAKYRLGF